MFEMRVVLGSALLSFVVVACAHQRSAPPESLPGPTKPAPTRGGLLPEGLVDAWQPKSCKLPTVYFDFDSSVLDPSSREAITTSVTCYMNGTLPTQVLVAGSTDPRGTEDYNLALGHRRASAVSKFLITLGIPADRVVTTSIGEERATGSDESSYRLDRFASTLEQ